MVIVKSCARVGSLIYVLNLLIFLRLEVDAFLVDITFVDDAVAKGAVCLDGSPPAYHFSPGFGSGLNNWLVHMEGGGWCKNVEDCLDRKDNHRGSSRKMEPLSFSGILSNEEKFNPDFFNWNKVKVRYCDGSSFTGDVESVDPVTNLHYRGARIWNAVIEDLLAKGMSNAQNALLSGCSAGGLASILHCDRFHDLLPTGTTVKCLSDAGYFINSKDILGIERVKSYFEDIVTTHGSTKNLPSSCTSQVTPSMCFFPQYVVQNMRTPLFILNAAYDTWQIKNVLAPNVDDPDDKWHDCKLDIKDCPSSQLQTLQGHLEFLPHAEVAVLDNVPLTQSFENFRSEFLRVLPKMEDSSPIGMFINSCFAHCQSGSQATWLQGGSPMIENTTIAKAVGEWFYGRSIRKIDCAYPCNSSCHNGAEDSD